MDSDPVPAIHGVHRTLSLDPQHLERTQLSVSIPVGLDSTTNEVVDRELRCEKYGLDANTTSEIRFVSDAKSRGRTTPSRPNRGDLTLHGGTKPVDWRRHSTGPAFNFRSPRRTRRIRTALPPCGALSRRRQSGTLIGDQVTLRIAAEFSKS